MLHFNKYERLPPIPVHGQEKRKVKFTVEALSDPAENSGPPIYSIYQPNRYNRRESGCIPTITAPYETIQHVNKSDKQQKTGPPKEVILPGADWEKIQSTINQPDLKRLTRQELVELNLKNFSREADKRLNEGADKQRKKRGLEKQEREKYLDMLAAEELESKRQDGQTTIYETNFQRFHQDIRVRKFNSSLCTANVQKENDLQLNVYRDKQKRTVEERKRLDEEAIRRELEEASGQEQQKANQRQLTQKALTDYHLQQVEEKMQLREEQRQQEKEERARLRDLDQLQAQELRQEKLKIRETKKNDLTDRREEISSRHCQRETEAQKQITEEKDRKRVGRFLTTLQHRKDDRAEDRKCQVKKDIVAKKLAESKKVQAATTNLREDSKISREVAEQDALVAKQQRDREEKRAAILKNISSHRERKKQEKEQKEKADEQSHRDFLQAQKESNRLFATEKRLKAKRDTDKKIECRDFNLRQKAEKRARLHLLQKAEQEIEMKYAKQMAEKDNQLLQYVQRELLKAADTTGGNPVIYDAKDPQYFCRKTDQPMPSLVTDQTRVMKQYLERNSLEPNMGRSSTADSWSDSESSSYRSSYTGGSSTTSPPASVEGSGYRATDTGKSLLRHHIAPTDHGAQGLVLDGMEESNYRAPFTGEKLPKYSTAQTQLIRQKQECNKLQLTYVENSTIDLPPSRFPSISTKGSPLGKCSVPAGMEESNYRAPFTGEKLPKYSTTQTQFIRQKQERNKLQLTYVENSKIDLPPSRFPSISTKGSPLGKCSVPAGMEESNYRAPFTGEKLPKYSTTQTQFIRQKQERNKLQLTYVENSKIDLPPSRFPSISTKGSPLGKCSVPAGMEESNYRAPFTGEKLPKYSTTQTQLIRQKQERNKLQLTYVENSTIDLPPSRFPSISTKGSPLGKCSVPAGMEESNYRAPFTGEKLPKYSTTQTQFIRQKQERNKLQLTYVENSTIDLPPSRFPSISTKGSPLGKCSVPAGMEESNYRAPFTGEKLPKYSTTQTQLIRQKQERNKLQLTYVENSTIDLPPSRFPSISTKGSPLGKCSVPAGMEESNYRAPFTGEKLPKYSTTQTQFIRQKQERNKLQLTYVENSKPQYYLTDPVKSLPRYATAETQYIKMRQERKKLLPRRP